MKKAIIGMDLTKWEATSEEIDSAFRKLQTLQNELDEVMNSFKKSDVRRTQTVRLVDFSDIMNDDIIEERDQILREMMESEISSVADPLISELLGN